MYTTTVIAENKWMAYGNPHIKDTVDWCQDEYEPALLNKNNEQCCLGFEPSQCGIPKRYLLNIGMPDDIGDMPRASYRNAKNAVREKIPHLVAPGRWNINSDFSKEASKINDDEDMSYPEKKRALQKLWKEYGWRLVFVKTVAEMNRKINELQAK